HQRPPSCLGCFNSNLRISDMCLCKSKEALTDSTLKTMVANWAPYADRSPSGYYKGLSVKERADPFQ
ncbi:hypothetical protein CYMTET_10080, partial [Cymbomonas tetramitiformis]